MGINKTTVCGIALTAFLLGAPMWASLPALAAGKSRVAMQNPKREFRGAWLHVIGQTQWQNKTTQEAKKYIEEQFQKLQEIGRAHV